MKKLAVTILITFALYLWFFFCAWVLNLNDKPTTNADVVELIAFYALACQAETWTDEIFDKKKKKKKSE